MAVNIIILKESTICRLLFRILFRKQSFLLSVDPILPPLNGVLNSLSKWALKSNYVTDAHELNSGNSQYKEPLPLTVISNTFTRIEHWQNEYFYFCNTKSDAEYGMAFRQITCKYLEQYYSSILFLNQVFENLPAHEQIQLSGFSRDIKQLLDFYQKTPDCITLKRQWNILESIFNAALTITITIYSLFWVLSKTRLTVSTSNVFLAADYLGDSRDNNLYKEVESIGSIALIKRNFSYSVNSADYGDQYSVSDWKNGRFNFASALAAMGMIGTDAAKILFKYHWAASNHFYQIIICPFKKIVMRALFNTIRPKNFWGRDEYNVEHILRWHELKRIGGRSLGIMHGVQSHGDLNPRRRYICFDHFYVFGTYLYEKHYKKTWAANMRVSAIGSFGFSQEQFSRGKNENSDSIVIFSSLLCDQSKLIDAILKIADTFPQYRILIKPKFADTLDSVKSFFPNNIALPDNIEVTRLSAADLISSARYVLSDASSVITEALHFGIPALMLDIIPNHPQCLYREFPGLCVSSGADAIAQLVKWESGAESFDRNNYADLIGPPNQWAFRIIGDDMGVKANVN